MNTDDISPSFLSLREGDTASVAMRRLIVMVPANFIARNAGYLRHFDATALLVRIVIVMLVRCLDYS